MTREELATRLEDLVDATTLKAVVERLVDVAYAKRDHILTEWQDKPLAREWGYAAALLERVSQRVDV